MKGEPRERVKLDTPDEILRFLGNVQGYAAELHAAAEDATRPFRKRVYSRGHARRRVERAWANVKETIQAGREALYAARDRATADRGCR